MADNKNEKSGFHLRLSWIIVAVVAIGAGLYLSLHHTVVTIRGEQVARQNLISSISTNGKVEPVANFEAHAPLATTVTGVFVHAGDQVRRGQLLLRLDDSAVKEQIARAQAQLKSAQADKSTIEAGGTRPDILTLQDQISKAQSDEASAQSSLGALKKLQQSGAASAGEVQQAQVRLQIAQNSVRNLGERKSQPFAPQELQRVNASITGAEAAVSAAEDMLRQLEVRSTVNGTVYQVPVRPGNFVNGGDLLVQVADLKNLQVRAFVDEPEIGKVHTGQPVTILWDALPTQSWMGTVKTVPLTVTPRGTRTVGEVLCSVDSSSGSAKLLPNVNVNVAIQVARRDNVLTAPREAVHQDGEGRFVLVVRDGRLRRAGVETGISSLTRVEVTSGVSQGEWVAINALSGQPLQDGMYVKLPE